MIILHTSIRSKRKVTKMFVHKALFLDRDGIINVDHGYVHTIKDFQFTEGIFELASLFQSSGYTLFVITNQSGISRGYYKEEDFNVLTEWMIEAFKQNDVKIEKVYYCPHLPNANCQCRKPNTGMIEQATSQYSIDLAHSWMIGDKQSDIDLAHNGHISNSIAIGDGNIKNATLHFKTIPECLEYLQENQGKIL